MASPLKGKYLFTYDGWTFLTAEGKSYTKEELARQELHLDLFSVSKVTGRTTFRAR